FNRVADGQAQLGVDVGAASLARATCACAAVAGAHVVAEHAGKEVGESAAAEDALEILGVHGLPAAALGRAEVLAVLPVLAELVVLGALIGVGQYFLGLVDALEFLLGGGPVVACVAVRVPFH